MRNFFALVAVVLVLWLVVAWNLGHHPGKRPRAGRVQRLADTVQRVKRIEIRSEKEMKAQRQEDSSQKSAVAKRNAAFEATMRVARGGRLPAGYVPSSPPSPPQREGPGGGAPGGDSRAEPTGRPVEKAPPPLALTKPQVAEAPRAVAVPVSAPVAPSSLGHQCQSPPHMLQYLIPEELPAQIEGKSTDTMDLCPICGSPHSTEFATERADVDGNGKKPYHLTKCDRCGMLYINPMPFDIKATKVYKEYWVGMKVDAMRRKIREFFTQKDMDNIHSWLDIGAGNGELLKAVSKEIPQANGTGLENNSFKMKGAAKHGIYLKKRDLGEIEEKFDIVSSMNVLSHVTRPVAFFQSMARLLKPDGCIFMSTGNSADITAEESPGGTGKFSLPDHLNFAGKRHVHTILCRAGLNATIYREFKHFWHNYRALKKGPFRAVYVLACRPGSKRGKIHWQT